MNVSYFYRILLGSFFGLCCAIFPVSVVAADPPVRYDPVTTTYYTTPEFLKKPAGARTYTRDVTPLIEHWDDGLRQRMGGGVTIEAQRVRAPFTAYVRATGSALKIAAYRCFTSLRCNAALVAGSYGLGALLDAVDWVIDEGGNVKKVVSGGLPESYGSGIYSINSPPWTTSCNYFDTSPDFIYSKVELGSNKCTFTYCPASRIVNGESYALSGYELSSSSMKCYFGGPAFSPEISEEVPVSLTEIEQEIESNYQPDPTDWPALAKFLPINDLTYSVDPIPTQKEDPIVSTDYDASGNPTGSIERSREHDFEILNNGSSNPELQVNTKEITKRYEGGQLVSSTETEESLVPEEPIPPPQQPPVELPEGCALFDPFCQWAKWTQKDLDEDDPDLSSLMHDFEPENDEFTITLGAASCPAPIDVELSIIGRSVELSYEPICDLVEFIRPLILVSAYLFAAYLYLGVLRG